MLPLNHFSLEGLMMSPGIHRISTGKMSFKILGLLIMISMLSNSFAQSVNIQGVLIDLDSTPIVGANVYLKNSGIKDTTDMAGKFQISDLPSSAIRFGKNTKNMDENMINIQYIFNLKGQRASFPKLDNPSRPFAELYLVGNGVFINGFSSADKKNYPLNEARGVATANEQGQNRLLVKFSAASDTLIAEIHGIEYLNVPLSSSSGDLGKLKIRSPSLAAFFNFTTPQSDLSGNNNNGTLSNVSSIQNQTGKDSSGLLFNGANSEVTIPHSPSISISNEFTILAMIKSSSGGTIFSKDAWCPDGKSPFSGNGANFAIDTAGHLALSVCQLGNYYHPRAKTTSPTPISKDWHFVAATFENGFVKLYSDGILLLKDTLTLSTDDPQVKDSIYSNGFREFKKNNLTMSWNGFPTWNYTGTLKITKPFPNTEPARVGLISNYCSPYLPQAPFSGQVSKVAIYLRSLSDEEIKVFSTSEKL